MNSSPEPRVLRPGRRTRVATLEYESVESLLLLHEPDAEMERQAQLSADATPPIDPAQAVEAAVNAGFREGFESGRAEGFRVGASEGRERGHAEGEAAARRTAEEGFVRELRPTLRALDEAVAQLDAVDAMCLRDIESDVVDLAFAVLRELMGRELELAESPTRDALRRCLLLAPDRGDVIARVNPTDLEGLTKTDELAPGRRIQFLADPKVERGGAVMEVDACRIDGQLTPALERVRQALSAATIGARGVTR
jgi:flagellar assembly protein FliH